MSGQFELTLLGGVEARHEGADPVPISGVGLQALVAILSLAAPHPVSSDHLIDELWGDEQPGNPENALQVKISQLRRLLGREAVVRREPGYVLVVEPDDVDALRLERFVREGREAASSGHQRRAADHFEAALSLIHGEPFGDLLDYRFARVAASRVEELVLAAQEGLADAKLALGLHGDAVASLIELVRDHPLRERFHAQLMVALYRCGRQAEALHTYKVARDVLLDELGLEPGPELKALEHSVLTHDPALGEGLSVIPTLPQATSLPAERGLDAWRTAESTADDYPTGRLPVVGRDPELRALHADIAAAIAGRGRLALLGGEPGIGKTRLAEELSNDATALGAVVVWSRCYEGRGAPAFWPWTQIVNGLLARFEEEDLRAALGSDAAELAQIAPEVKEHVPILEPMMPLDPEAARFRVYRAVGAFIYRLASRNPLVLVIDDLHRADASSMELLTFVASNMFDVHLLVVATYRNVDPTIGAELSVTLAELSRRSLVRRVDLSGLDRSGLARLLSAAGAQPSDELLATIHRRTQGNPFFVTEILRLLPAGGGLPDARAVGRVVPSGVGGVIRQRIARLPNETARTLTAASVLGQDFDLAVVAAILDVDGPTILEWLEPAVLAGILSESSDGVGRYRFCHGLVTETVYDDMGAAQRARMHLRAAEALEERHGDADGPHLIALAAHWFHAVPAGPPDKGIHYALRSAQWAQAHVAHRQAEDQLRAALELLAGVPESRHRAERELEIQNQLSGLLIVTQGDSAEGVERACTRIRELCRAIDDNALLLPALWRLAVFHCVRLELDTTVALGEQLIQLAGPERTPGPLLAGHLTLGRAHTHLGNFVAAREHLDKAMELCAAGHDQSIVGVVLETPAVFARVILSWNIWMLGDEEGAEHLALEAVAAGALDGLDSYGTTFANWCTVRIAALSQRAEVARQRSEDGISRAMERGHAMFITMMAAVHGWAIASLGDTRAGGAELDAMCAAMEAAGVKMLRHFWLALRADVELMVGRNDTALTVVDDALANVEATGERWYEAELHRLRGEALAGIGGQTTTAEIEFRRAIDIATAQSAQGLQRRAEASLARLADR